MHKGIGLALLSLLVFSFASADENDSLSASVQQMKGQAWSVNGDSIKSTREVILKKSQQAKQPYSASGDPTAGSGDPTKGSGDPTAGSGDPTLRGSAGSNPVTAADIPQRAQSAKKSKQAYSVSNDPTAGAGDPTKGSGDPTVGSGDPTVGSGDPTAGHLAQFEVVLLPARGNNKQPRCKMSVSRKESSNKKSETLTLGSGSQLKLSSVKIESSASGKNKYYVGNYEVFRDSNKKADLTLTCDLSEQAAVSKSEIQAAFSKLGFVGTMPLGFKELSKPAVQKSTSSKASEAVH